MFKNWSVLIVEAIIFFFIQGQHVEFFYSNYGPEKCRVNIMDQFINIFSRGEENVSCDLVNKILTIYQIVTQLIMDLA